MKSKTGFTIVELLVVIVVIAILAAMSLVSYAGIQNRAYDTARQHDSKQIEKAVRNHEAIAGSVFPTVDRGDGTAVIAEYGLSSMANLRYASSTGGTPGSEAYEDKHLVYMTMYSNAVGWVYWSYAEDTWKVVSIDETGTVNTYTETRHPWSFIGTN